MWTKKTARPPAKVRAFYAGMGAAEEADALRKASALTPAAPEASHPTHDEDDIHKPHFGRKAGPPSRALDLNADSLRFTGADMHVPVITDPRAHTKSAIRVSAEPHLLAITFGAKERDHSFKFYKAGHTKRPVLDIATCDVTAVRRDLLDQVAQAKMVLTYMNAAGDEVELALFVPHAVDRDMIWQLTYSVTVGDAPLAARQYGFPRPPMLRRGQCRVKGNLRSPSRFIILSARRLLIYGSAPKTEGKLDRKVPLLVLWLAGASVGSDQKDKTMLRIVTTTPRTVQVKFASDIEVTAWLEAIRTAITKATASKGVLLVDTVQPHGQDIRARSVTDVLRARGSTIVPPPPPINHAQDQESRESSVSVAPPPPSHLRASFSVAASPLASPKSVMSMKIDDVAGGIQGIPEEEEEDESDDDVDDTFDAQRFVLNVDSRAEEASRHVRMSLPTLRNSVIHMSINGALLPVDEEEEKEAATAKGGAGAGWTCSCGCRDGNGKTECTECHKAPPAFVVPQRAPMARGGAGAGWTCVCGCRNRTDVHRCMGCRAMRPDMDAPATLPTRAPGAPWSCPCGLGNNHADIETCPLCGLERDVVDPEDPNAPPMVPTEDHPVALALGKAMARAAPVDEHNKVASHPQGDDHKDDDDDSMLHEYDGKKRWVMDDECSKCCQCASPFSTRKRKHHCRYCGKVFCGACTSHFALLGAQSIKSRVCDRCNLHVLATNDRPEPLKPPAGGLMAFSRRG